MHFLFVLFFSSFIFSVAEHMIAIVLHRQTSACALITLIEWSFVIYISFRCIFWKIRIENACAFVRLGIIWFLLNYFRSHARHLKVPIASTSNGIVVGMHEKFHSIAPGRSFNYLIMPQRPDELSRIKINPDRVTSTDCTNRCDKTVSMARQSKFQKQ